jgi:hypothetical protein
MSERKRELYTVVKEQIDKISLKLTGEIDDWNAFKAKLLIEENYEGIVLCDEMIKLNKRTRVLLQTILEIPVIEVEMITILFMIEMKTHDNRYKEIKDAFNNLSTND